MTHKITFSFITIVVLLLVGLYAFSSSVSGSIPQGEIRWIIGHEPTSLFDRASDEFSETLNTERDAVLELDIIAPEQVGYSHDVPTNEILLLLDENEVDMATVLVGGLSLHVPELQATNLPFLFDDIDSALNALDGPFGDTLLDSVSTQTKYHALAFTLSGGMRVLASSERTFQSSDDFHGKSILTTAGSVGEETYKELGAIPISNTLGARAVDEQESIDAVETTYTRIAALSETDFVKYISETNHSAFLTMILVSDHFYESLSEHDQILLKKAATAAATAEREDSIELAENVRSNLKDQGVVIEQLPAETMEELKKQTSPVYSWFSETIGGVTFPTQ